MWGIPRQPAPTPERLTAVSFPTVSQEGTRARFSRRDHLRPVGDIVYDTFRATSRGWDAVSNDHRGTRASICPPSTVHSTRGANRENMFDEDRSLCTADARSALSRSGRGARSVVLLYRHPPGRRPAVALSLELTVHESIVCLNVSAPAQEDDRGAAQRIRCSILFLPGFHARPQTDPRRAVRLSHSTMLSPMSWSSFQTVLSSPVPVQARPYRTYVQRNCR